MSTKQKKLPNTKGTHADRATNDPTSTPIDAQKGKTILELVKDLQHVDTKSKRAKANETSMEDNNGGEVFYPWIGKGLNDYKDENKK